MAQYDMRTGAFPLRNEAAQIRVAGQQLKRIKLLILMKIDEQAGVRNPIDYEYDVFFSYKRHTESDEWHRITMEKLKYWLTLELGQTEVRFFFDTEDIRSGARWRERILRALRSSKTMVCVWSPLYFQSPWCVSEWMTFVEREKRYHRELLIPARYHDGISFPAEAQAKQPVDLTSYTSTFTSFWGTGLAVEFEQRCLKRFASDLAELVRWAPPFESDFPLVEAQEHQRPQLPVFRRIADV